MEAIRDVIIFLCGNFWSWLQALTIGMPCADAIARFIEQSHLLRFVFEIGGLEADFGCGGNDGSRSDVA